MVTPMKVNRICRCTVRWPVPPTADAGDREAHGTDLHMRVGCLQFGEHAEGLLTGEVFEEFLGLAFKEEVCRAGQYECRAGDLLGDATREVVVQQLAQNLPW